MSKIAIPHKHQTQINIWAADTTTKFEYRVDSTDSWDGCSGSPGWNPNYQYRVKPKPPVAKYIIAYGDYAGRMGFSEKYYLDTDDFKASNTGMNYKWVQTLIGTKKMFDGE